MRKHKTKPRLNPWEKAVKAELLGAGLFPESQVVPFTDSKHRMDFRLKKQRVFIEVDGMRHRNALTSIHSDAVKVHKAFHIGFRVIRIQEPNKQNAVTWADFVRRSKQMAADLKFGMARYYY